MKVLKLLLLLLALSLPSLARARVYGFCEEGGQTITVLGYQSSVTTPVQRSFPPCTVTVYLPGTLTPATIYADNAGTPLANPFTLGVPPETSTIGYWFFYADDGKYDVNFSGTGITTPFTLGDIPIIDPCYLSPSTGAVCRAIDSKLSDFLSVLDFGCAGDGVTDDTVCIQRAIDAAAVRGKTVWFPAPVSFYGITAPLVARTNTSLMCDAYGLTPTEMAGKPTTRIKSLASWGKLTGDALLTNDPLTQSPYVTINNCTFEGNATTGPDYGIYFLDGNTLTLTNVLVDTSRLDGIFLDNNSTHPAQSGTFNNVVIINAVKNTGLAARHGALHIEWTDVVLNAVYPTTSSEADYSQTGKRIACWFGPSSASGAMTNSDCSHSEVGVRVEGSNWRFATSRSEFNASDGWQVVGSGNSFTAVLSQFDGRATANTYDGFNVTGSGNTFSSTTETAAAGAQVKNGMHFVNSNNPPNTVHGNQVLNGGAAIGAEVLTSDPQHLVWDNYRRVPDTGSTGGGWTAGTTGAIDVTKTNFVLLSNGVSAAYTVTGLNSGVPGQRVTLIYVGNANPPTILSTASIFLTKPWQPTTAAYQQGTIPHATLTLHTPDGTNWYEVERSDISTGIGPQTAFIDDLAETANNKYSDFQSNTGNQQVQGRLCDDAIATCNPWVTVKRTGATPTVTSLPERVIVNAAVGSDDGAASLQVSGFGRFYGTTFSGLGTPANGNLIYCSDCTNASNPCTGAGSGAFAKRLAGAWDCR